METKSITELYKTINSTIPTREEFHRYYIGAIYESDFCTYAPSEHNIDRIQSSINFTYRLVHKEKQLNKYREHGRQLKQDENSR